MVGTLLKKVISCVTLAAFVLLNVTPSVSAQTISAAVSMSAPGTLTALSEKFTPAHLVGMTVDPRNAFKFDFIIHKGDLPLTLDQKKEEYRDLVKYFLAALAVPDDKQWVNLSPYESNRIIDDNFGMTEMGRDLLAQDYILKQLTASLMHPDSELGKKFWDKIYEKTYAKYGTTDIPLDTFNKVWIIPDKAVVYEKGQSALIVDSHLKVMLEEDYLATQKEAVGAGFKPARNSPTGGSETRPYDRLMPVGAIHESPGEGQPDVGARFIAPGGKAVSSVISEEFVKAITRDVILPVLEQQVNESKNFANLRQIVSGMILATWYKKALKESILGKLYADQGKVKGVDQDPANNQKIWEQYVTAFKKGAVNMIREDYDKYSAETIPRKYFSGGITHFSATMVTYTASSVMTQPVKNAAQAGDIELASANVGPVSHASRALSESARFDGEKDHAQNISQELDLRIAWPRDPEQSLRPLTEKIKSVMERVKDSDPEAISALRDQAPFLANRYVLSSKEFKDETESRGLLNAIVIALNVLAQYDPFGFDTGVKALVSIMENPEADWSLRASMMGHLANTYKSIKYAREYYDAPWNQTEIPSKERRIAKGAANRGSIEQAVLTAGFYAVTIMKGQETLASKNGALRLLIAGAESFPTILTSEFQSSADSLELMLKGVTIDERNPDGIQAMKLVVRAGEILSMSDKFYWRGIGLLHHLAGHVQGRDWQPDPDIRSVAGKALLKVYLEAAKDKTKEVVATEALRRLVFLDPGIRHNPQYYIPTMRALLRQKAGSAESRKLITSFMRSGSHLAYYFLDNFAEDKELLKSVVSSPENDIKCRVYAYGLFVQHSRTVASHQVEDWGDVSRKLVDNGWASRISPTEVQLTVDPMRERARMSAVLGVDTFNIVLQAYRERIVTDMNFYEKVEGLLKSSQGLDIAKTLNSAFATQEIRTYTLAMLLYLRPKLNALFSYHDQFEIKLKKVMSAYLTHGLHNANSRFELGTGILKKGSTLGMILIGTHELGHNFLFDDFALTGESLGIDSIHEFVSDVLFRALGEYLNLPTDEMDKTLNGQEDYQWVKAHGWLAPEGHVAARAQELAIRNVINDRKRSFMTGYLEHIFLVATHEIGDSRGDFYLFIKASLIGYANQRGARIRDADWPFPTPLVPEGRGAVMPEDQVRWIMNKIPNYAMRAEDAAGYRFSVQQLFDPAMGQDNIGLWWKIRGSLKSKKSTELAAALATIITMVTPPIALSAFHVRNPHVILASAIVAGLFALKVYPPILGHFYNEADTGRFTIVTRSGKNELGIYIQKDLEYLAEHKAIADVLIAEDLVRTLNALLLSWNEKYYDIDHITATSPLLVQNSTGEVRAGVKTLIEKIGPVAMENKRLKFMARLAQVVLRSLFTGRKGLFSTHKLPTFAGSMRLDIKSDLSVLKVNLGRLVADLDRINATVSEQRIIKEKRRLLFGTNKGSADHVAEERSGNAAMSGDVKGGIDLNQASMDMQIRRDGNGVPLPVNQQNLENIRIDGLVPTILTITPITKLPMLSDAGSSPVAASSA